MVLQEQLPTERRVVSRLQERIHLRVFKRDAETRPLRRVDLAETVDVALRQTGKLLARQQEKVLVLIDVATKADPKIDKPFLQHLHRCPRSRLQVEAVAPEVPQRELKVPGGLALQLLTCR